jgi:hypothetical protein
VKEAEEEALKKEAAMQEQEKRYQEECTRQQLREVGHPYMFAPSIYTVKCRRVRASTVGVCVRVRVVQ